MHSLYNTIVVACWNFLCIPPYSSLHIRLFDDTVDAPPPHILMYSSFLVFWCIVKCPSGFVMHCIFSWLYWGALNRILIVFWCIVRPLTRFYILYVYLLVLVYSFSLVLLWCVQFSFGIEMHCKVSFRNCVAWADACSWFLAWTKQGWQRWLRSRVRHMLCHALRLNSIC